MSSSWYFSDDEPQLITSTFILYAPYMWDDVHFLFTNLRANAVHPYKKIAGQARNDGKDRSVGANCARPWLAIEC